MSAPEQYQLVETRLQEKLPNGTTRCNLCLWRCKISHGQRGFCQAHVNRDGTLYNLSYGILSSIDIDPIEDKPVKHYRPGTRVMSVGSYGCSFRCGGCHNLDISWGVEALDDLARGESREAWVSPQSLVDSALRADVQGIAFTYSEPAVWLEYVIDTARLAHEAGLYTVYVSNSFVTDEALELAAPYIDVLCSDIKSLSDDFYREICRPARVEQVLHSIKKAHELGIHVETRTNIIPGKNDDPEEHYRIACWVRDNLGKDSPWHITRFFPAYKLSDVPPTPEATLFAARDAAERAGLENIYVYNDKGCDCAAENRPVSSYLGASEEEIHQVRKCAASCCGDEGVLLKKYEQDLADQQPVQEIKMTRMVQCVVLKVEAEGLDKPPHPGELGIRIYENVSQEGWAKWLERLTTIINENGLTTADEKAIDLIEKHMQGFFFGEGDYGQLPAGFQQGGGGKK